MVRPSGNLVWLVLVSLAIGLIVACGGSTQTGSGEDAATANPAEAAASQMTKG